MTSSEKTFISTSDSDEFEEFKKVCRPVVEFIQKRYGTPHHRVIIDWASAVLVQDMKGVPFKVPD